MPPTQPHTRSEPPDDMLDPLSLYGWGWMPYIDRGTQIDKMYRGGGRPYIEKIDRGPTLFPLYGYKGDSPAPELSYLILSDPIRAISI